MKREEIYHKSVNILVQAYFNDELVKGDCAKCAVGNLLKSDLWANVFATTGGIQYYMSNVSYVPYILGLETIRASDYSLEELMKIEYTFETSFIGEDPMFNSLMAVIDVLDEIHENKDEEVSQATKQKFVKV